MASVLSIQKVKLNPTWIGREGIVVRLNDTAIKDKNKRKDNDWREIKGNWNGWSCGTQQGGGLLDHHWKW